MKRRTLLKSLLFTPFAGLVSKVFGSKPSNPSENPNPIVLSNGSRITMESTLTGNCRKIYFDDGPRMTFSFRPWHFDPNCTATPRDISNDLNDYFASLKKQGLFLSNEQQAWYANMLERRHKTFAHESRADAMKLEYPSTIGEILQ